MSNKETSTSEATTETATTVEALPWDKEFAQFFQSIGLVETSECLASELIVLSRHHLEKLPEALELLVEKLLISLEKHVGAKEQILEKQQQYPSNAKIHIQHPDLLVPTRKRKRSDNEEALQEQEEEEEGDRVKRLDSEQIQIRATTEEVNQRINTFIQAKQNELDESNRTEFLSRHDPTADDVTCARTDAREINRNIQMKFDIVNNEDGPLARSLTAFNDNKQQQQQQQMATTIITTSATGADTTERVNNIEQHLNVRLDDDANPPFSIFERIKILENTLMEIECQYPKWAAVHFNQPNRNFPPPPPIKYISRPTSTTSTTITTAADNYLAPTSPLVPPIPIDDESKDATYVSTQVTTTAPSLPKNRMIQTTGRANSSLTRAVIDQLNRQNQLSVTRQTMK